MKDLGRRVRREGKRKQDENGYIVSPNNDHMAQVKINSPPPPPPMLLQYRDPFPKTVVRGGRGLQI